MDGFLPDAGSSISYSRSINRDSNPNFNFYTWRKYQYEYAREHTDEYHRLSSCALDRDPQTCFHEDIHAGSNNRQSLNTDAHPNIHEYTHPHSQLHSDPNCDRDIVAHADCHQHVNADEHSDSNEDFHSNQHTNADKHSHINFHADQYTDSHGDVYSYKYNIR